MSLSGGRANPSGCDGRAQLATPSAFAPTSGRAVALDGGGRQIRTGLQQRPHRRLDGAVVGQGEHAEHLVGTAAGDAQRQMAAQGGSAGGGGQDVEGGRGGRDGPAMGCPGSSIAAASPARAASPSPNDVAISSRSGCPRAMTITADAAPASRARTSVRIWRVGARPPACARAAAPATRISRAASGTLSARRRRPPRPGGRSAPSRRWGTSRCRPARACASGHAGTGASHPHRGRWDAPSGGTRRSGHGR